MTLVVRDSATLRQVLNGPRAVVMTMGALHEGHARLMEVAREECPQVVTTIFVNPLQFGAGEDFDRYPRTFEADVDLCQSRGVDVVFAPTVTEMFPTPPQITVDPGALGDILEGAARPGHFRGVLTVVSALLHVTSADVALFGEKDYQQLTLIRQMAEELKFTGATSALRIAAVPTVRESDGLAMSSRNRYLTADERVTARRIPMALGAGAAAALRGAPAAEVLRETRLHLEGLDVDYVALTDPGLGEAPASGPARLLVAVRVGSTRLIDNMAVTLAEDHAG